MSIYKHKNGYYGYNFMYRGQRHCHTFKGLTKVEVETKELEHKFALRNSLQLVSSAFIQQQAQPQEDEHKPTWGEAVKDFKEYAKVHYVRPNACMYVLKAFSKMIKGIPLNEIKLKHIENYIAKRKNVVQHSTINRELNTIRKVFSLAIDNELIEKNPCKKLKSLRVYNQPERYLSKREERKLMKVCSPFMQTLIKTALYSGMRKNEILSLKWVDINWRSKYLIARETKNNKTREIPICDPLMEVLKSIPVVGEYVFTNPLTNDRYRDVYSSFKRAVKRSKIKHITFHQLRHTTASRLNELGVDIVTIQEILGHADVGTTRRYTHNRRESKIKAMKMLGNY